MADEPLGSAAAELDLPKWLLRGAVAVLVVGVLAYGLIWALGDEGKWGPRGDAVGPFAAVLNALALLALLHSLKLQRDALEAQRKELELQREELRLQRKEFADSREVMKEQAAQAERTAAAQEALAASQKATADHQKRANEIAETEHWRQRALLDEQRAQFERTIKAQEALAASQGSLAARQEHANEVAEWRAKLALSAEHAQRTATIANLQAALSQLNLATLTNEAQRQYGMQVPNIVAALKGEVGVLVLSIAREKKRLDALDDMLDGRVPRD